MKPFQLPPELCPQLHSDTVLSQFGAPAQPYIEAVQSLMAMEEYPVHMLIQDRVRAMKIHPSALVLTNRRILVVQRKLFSQSFLDMPWGVANDAHLVENWKGATFAVQAINNSILEVDALPIQPARAAYAFAQRAEELSAEWRRWRQMEEERARARGVSVADLPSFAPPPVATPAPALPSPPDIEANLIKLQDLKNKGLISEEEYSNKRSELLSQL